MRDVIRLTILAILVFVVVGFAMLYSRDSQFRYGVTAFLSDGWAAVRRAAGELAGRDEDGPQLAPLEVRVARPNQTDWIGLAGLPDVTEVRFPIPAAGSYSGGELDLHLDVQLAKGGDGLLSVLINDTVRSRIVLDTGHSTYNIQIPLGDADLLADHVAVTLSARGTTNSGQICPTDSSSAGSAILLLPQSELVLQTMRELDDPETTLIALPDPLRLLFGDTEEAQTTAVWAAQRMERAGVRTLLVEGREASVPHITIGPAGGEVVRRSPRGDIVLAGGEGVNRAIAFRRLDPQAAATLSDWPVSVASLGVETQARSFRGSRRWTIPYRIADLPGGFTPTRFRLDLKTSTLEPEFEWMVRVTLNGNLLHTRRFPGDLSELSLEVELPSEMQGLSNALLVELVDTTPNESICRVGPDAQAQLLPSSRLYADGSQPRSGWGAMVRLLASAEYVAPGNHGLLQVHQGARAAAMLTQFLPVNANVAFDPRGPAVTITLMDRYRLEQLISDNAGNDIAELERAWLITDTGQSVENPLALYAPGTFDPGAVLARMHSEDVAFIVRRTQNP